MPKKRRKKKGRYHRGEYVSQKTGQTCKFRSGWEEKLMVHLDASPEVTFWSYEQVTIEYISNIRSKKIRRYYPDFFVRYSDGREQLIEVKPKRKLEQLTVRKKIDAAREWCGQRGMTFELITEVELKQMGLI